MARQVLFDTCAAIWFMESAPFTDAADRAVAEALADGIPIAISPITAWEVGFLVSKRRLVLSFEPLEWFERMIREPGMSLVEMPTRILIESSRLPGDPPNDPADRIIAATARELGMVLVTRDRALTAYGKAGHIDVIVC
jgi:PIN domain nuclease of toxin-antitoxin system